MVALAGYYPPLGVFDAPGLNGLLEADVEYQSSRYTEEFNDREVASFTLVNARIGCAERALGCIALCEQRVR